MKIKIKKTIEDAVIPIFAHSTDTGFDLFTCEDVEILPHKKVIARTGLIFDIPKGWGIQVKNKSGITVNGVPTVSGKNADITIYEGTIDMDYRGEVGIMIKNEEEERIVIPKHTKIAQGVLRKVYSCTFEEVQEVSETERGKGGFGSTGTKL